MAKTLVCYHRDLDGFGAAFAFWKKYMRDKNFKAAHGEVEYESVQYGEPFPKKASDYTHIYVLDFTFDRAICDELDKVAQLTVIDHHEGKFKDLEGARYAVLDASMSGAELTWKTLSGSPIPDVIKYVGDYDLHTFLLPNSREITSYLRFLDWDFEVWDNIDMNVALQIGTVLWAQVQSEAKFLASRSMPVEYLGVKTRIFDAPIQYNEASVRLYESEVLPFVVFYRHDGDKWLVGLRGNQGWNLIKVANIFGGGGHRNASGLTFTGNFNPTLMANALLSAFHALYVGRMSGRQARQFAESQLMPLGLFTLAPYVEPGPVTDEDFPPSAEAGEGVL